jgi:hypothetical protein
VQEKLKEKEPELWPERVYQWGTSEAMNPQHSDLLLLRKLLLEEAVEEISHSKIHRYLPAFLPTCAAHCNLVQLDLRSVSAVEPNLMLNAYIACICDYSVIATAQN